MNDRSNIIAQVIDEACRQRGWNLSQLARHVGKSSTTLSRWKDGTSGNCDVFTLAEIFRLAGLSMDEAFRLSNAPAGMTAADAGMELKREVEELRSQLGRHESVLNGLHSVFALLGEGASRRLGQVHSARAESSGQAEQESCLSDVLSSLDRTLEQLDREPDPGTGKQEEESGFGWQRRA
ncbi:MAG: helix-turn-helix transcriptional regulator [bacterium]